MADNYLIIPKTSDQALLAKYYSMADVFTICSSRENFPTTCVEAQCCGTPVVGFDAGGTKETSILGEEDFVPYGDIESLRIQINKTLGRKLNRKELAEKAQEEFSKKTMAQRYLQEYDFSGYKDRILLLDVNCKYSSTGKICYDLYTEINKNGRQASICYGRGPLVSGKNIYKFGLDWETKLHAGLSRITGYNGCFSPYSTKRVIDYIEEFQPELIHMHELHAYFVNIKPLLSYIKQKGIPIIWTFHCEYMYTGKCGHTYDCENYMHGCGNCPSVQGYPRSLVFDKTKQMFDMKRKLLEDMDVRIITPSEWLAQKVRYSFLKNKYINVIHNGIDVDTFQPVDSTALRRELNIPDNHRIVLAVAPNIMSESKGGKWVLKLAEIMKEDSVFFVLVGRNNHLFSQNKI
ncbi:MAG: glycosyltransferase [Clostridia bacterium]|nr:glycosyltransferase [Clostridia bacterium]